MGRPSIYSPKPYWRTNTAFSGADFAWPHATVPLLKHPQRRSTRWTRGAASQTYLCCGPRVFSHAICGSVRRSRQPDLKAGQSRPEAHGSGSAHQLGASAAPVGRPRSARFLKAAWPVNEALGRGPAAFGLAGPRRLAGSLEARAMVLSAKFGQCPEA